MASPTKNTAALAPAADPHLARVDSLSLDALARHANEAARQAESSALYHAARAGLYLIEAKSRAKHGEWLPWLAQNWHYSVQHADRFVALANACEGDPARAAQLEAKSIRGALAALGKPVTGHGRGQKPRQDKDPNSSRVRNLTGATPPVVDADFSIAPESDDEREARRRRERDKLQREIDAQIRAEDEEAARPLVGEPGGPAEAPPHGFVPPAPAAPAPAALPESLDDAECVDCAEPIRHGEPFRFLRDEKGQATGTVHAACYAEGKAWEAGVEKLPTPAPALPALATPASTGECDYCGGEHATADCPVIAARLEVAEAEEAEAEELAAQRAREEAEMEAAMDPVVLARADLAKDPLRRDAIAIVLTGSSLLLAPFRAGLRLGHRANDKDRAVYDVSHEQHVLALLEEIHQHQAFKLEAKQHGAQGECRQLMKTCEERVADAIVVAREAVRRRVGRAAEAGL